MNEKGKERASRAREAYEQTQRRVGQSAVQAEQASVSRELQRGAYNRQQLLMAKEAALTRLDAQGLPDVQMVSFQKEVRSGLFRQLKTITTTEPGWQVYADSHKEDYLYDHRETVYLLADGTFVRDFSITHDAPSGNRWECGRVSLDDLAVFLNQKDVEGIVTGLNKLGSS
ncbi:MAG TPA: hypothetical protein VFT53_03990 [Candidatus Saccharimonadales bacterium]|nr:hypothetical protein [Candidatus Saccharimonadales bacterium]